MTALREHFARVRRYTADRRPLPRFDKGIIASLSLVAVVTVVLAPLSVLAFVVVPTCAVFAAVSALGVPTRLKDRMRGRRSPTSLQASGAVEHGPAIVEKGVDAPPAARVSAPGLSRSALESRAKESVAAPRATGSGADLSL